MSVEQTMDLIKFCNILISEIEKALSDGKLTGEEIKKILITNSGSAFNAVWRVWEVNDELIGCPQDEALRLQKEAMKVLLKLVRAIF
jgi:hypothetical protein